MDHHRPRRSGYGQDHRADRAVRLRFALAVPETARGLRRIILDSAPLPARPELPAPEAVEPSRTKKAVLLALYRAHPDYGNRGTASRVAAELAPQAGLKQGPPAATCTPNWTAGKHDPSHTR